MKFTDCTLKHILALNYLNVYVNIPTKGDSIYSEIRQIFLYGTKRRAPPICPLSFVLETLKRLANSCPRMSYCFAGNMHFMSWLFILKVYSVLNSIRWSCYLTLKVTPKKSECKSDKNRFGPV